MTWYVRLYKWGKKNKRKKKKEKTKKAGAEGKGHGWCLVLFEKAKEDEH